MGDKDDYLTCYREFFEHFAATVNPEDQLPVHIAGYTITEAELPGEVIYWTTQYLTEKQCPTTLMTPLRRIILDEVRVASKKYPNEFGFNSDESVYIALRLMQAVTARVNNVCLRYLDNSRLDTLPPPPPLDQRELKTISSATKNLRRVMEDRHVEFGNLEALFGIETTEPTSFYAVYDGHAGSAAATYCAAHLHQYLVESPYFITDLRQAMREAFLRTDAEFVRKSNQERACGGTTAVAVAVRGRRLMAAWAGDSLALLAKRMRLMQLVNPHKPDRQDERERVESSGGTVMHWGTWRVNGQLAVSRAIGDAQYKPYVTARPEIAIVDLDGDEDFVVVACDGLWDYVSEDEVALIVYRQLASDPDDLKAVTKRLIAEAKRQRSGDNITIIVVFLKDPRDIVADNCPPMDLGLDNALANAPPYGMEPNGLKLDAVSAMGAAECADADADNGVSDSDSEDLGPETAVDADVDDAERHDPAPPTPPAHAVEEGHVDGVLVDNVAESGEDSEDEWNYYKGEGERDREEQNPSEEVDEPLRSDTPCQDNSAWESSSVDMNSSPLNPDAPVFVPGAVGGSDVLLAESPRKPVPMDDIEIPDVAQFQTEAVIRPAELLDLDNSDHLNGHHNVSLDSVKEQFNGNDSQCNMDSLGFGFNIGIEHDKIKDNSLIQDFERIQKDTTDFCDIQVFQVHTEKNPFDDEDEALFERLKNKERDPMSMSFYQEKDDDTCERFAKSEVQVDLNAVQPLPDSDDEDIQPNGARDNFIEGEKENVIPEQNIAVGEDIHEPNNDIKLDDRTDVTSNITNLDNFIDYNINSANNIQIFSNVEFDCSNIPQDVLQTDTPESHKLLFEQIPEIPDGKSSELGFTNEDLQDPSESEKDMRVVTPQDMSQEMYDESPLTETQPDFVPVSIDVDLERDVENTRSLADSKDIIGDVVEEESSTISNHNTVLLHPSIQDEQKYSIGDIQKHSEQESQQISNKSETHIDSEHMVGNNIENVQEITETEEMSPVQTELFSTVESPIPAESPLLVESCELQASTTLESKSPNHMEELADEITDSTSPAPLQLPITAETLEHMSQIGKEDNSVSPLPAEVPLPRESPLPAESPMLEETVECEESTLLVGSCLPSDSPLPTESPLPVETVQVAKSPLPAELLSNKSPLPVENLSFAESPVNREYPVEESLSHDLISPSEKTLINEELRESPIIVDQSLSVEVQDTCTQMFPKESLLPDELLMSSESPLPTELSLPRESPLPTEVPSPRVSPLSTKPTLITESSQHMELQIIDTDLQNDISQSIEPCLSTEIHPEAESISKLDSVHDSETLLQLEFISPKPVAASVSPIPATESIMPVAVSESPMPPVESPIPAVLSPLPTVESDLPAVSSPVLEDTGVPAVSSPVLAVSSPLPADSLPVHVISSVPITSIPASTYSSESEHVPREDKLTDSICESRLTPEVQQEIVNHLNISTVQPEEIQHVEANVGPTPDIVPEEHIDHHQIPTELVTDIDIGIPESRAQEICVPITNEIKNEDAVHANAATPPPTPAVEPTNAAPPSLDIAPISDTPIAADISSEAIITSSVAAVGAAAVAVSLTKTKSKTPVTKKSPTTPTAKQTTTAKSVPKTTPPSRTPTSAKKSTTVVSASPAAPKLLAAKPSTPKAAATKPSPSPKAPKPSTPTTKPARPATVKEAPAVAKAAPTAKAAPVARAAPRAPASKPISAKPATAAPKTTTTNTSRAASAPSPKPPVRSTVPRVAPGASAKPKETVAKKKVPEKKPLLNGDVKTAAAKPAAKTSALGRPAPRAAPRVPATNVTAPAKTSAPRPATRVPLDKQSKDLANKRITAKTAPPRTSPTKAPLGAKSAAMKSVPKKVDVPAKIVQNGLPNGNAIESDAALVKPPPSPPAADNALLPDVIA